MEEIWARILAGECRAPGSFAFKTLSVLRDVSSDTAEAFIKLVRYRFQGNGSQGSIPTWEEFEALYAEAGLSYLDFMGIVDAGLVVGTASRIHDPTHGPIILSCGDDVGVRVDGGAQGCIRVNLLTRAGDQLARVASS